MMQYRSRRVADLIKLEISEIIRRELKDPRIGMVSITGVQMTEDLRYAKVFVSVLGNENEVKSSLIGLERATGFVRREIGRRLSLRYTPEIKFIYDESLRDGSYLLSLLDSVVKEEAEPDHHEP